MIYKIKGTLMSSLFIILILLVLSALVLYPIWTMLLLGAVFAYAIRPLASKLDRHIPYRSVSIIIVMMIVLLPLLGIIALIVDAIIHSMPQLLSTVEKLNISSLHNATSVYIPPEFRPSADLTFKIFTDLINNLLKLVTNYFIDLLKSMPMLALQLFILFASAFYFARDGDKIINYLSSNVPDKRKLFVSRMMVETERVLKSIFYGHFLTALIIGLMAVTGFQMLGYPYAAFMGLLAGFLQLIPVVGPWPTYTILAIYDFLSGNIIRGVIVLIFGAFLSTIDIYLRPKLSGKYANLHPLIFLLGFLGGPIIWGLAGFIVGPLILGVTFAALNVYKKEGIEKSD